MTTATARYTLTVADGTTRDYARKVDAVKAGDKAGLPYRVTSPAGQIVADNLVNAEQLGLERAMHDTITGPEPTTDAAPTADDVAAVLTGVDGIDAATASDAPVPCDPCAHCDAVDHEDGACVDPRDGGAGGMGPGGWHPATDRNLVAEKRARMDAPKKTRGRKSGDPRADRARASKTDDARRVSRDAHFVADGKDVRELPGVVRARRSQKTRALVVSVHAAAFGLDVGEGGPWAAQCLTHGDVMPAHTRRAASYALPHPETFCSGCRAALNS